MSVFDFGNMVQEFEAQLGVFDDSLEDTAPVLFADPQPAWRNNAPERGPSSLNDTEAYCEGAWLMRNAEWEALIGDDATALPFCCNATEGLRRAIVRIRDFGPSRFRYEGLLEAIADLCERHFLPEGSLVYELQAHLEEWCFDAEDEVWGL